MRHVIKISWQTLCILVASAALAFAVNALRPKGLPLVMPFPPESRCTSPVQAAAPVNVKQALTMFTRADAIFIDSRPREAFEKGHIERAWNIPYSLIDPIPDEAVQKLRSYRAVIIYCNTRGAEISTLMAGELSHEGLDGVAYLEGGFLEWVKAGGKYDGQRPEQYD